MTRVYTIGYQAATVPSFLAALEAAGIELLIDVRAIASSRRAGFAKTRLAENVHGIGIDYLHLRELGTPAEGRAAARAGRHAEMREIYRGHLATADARTGLHRLAELVTIRRACLLCFESDPSHCHRSLVAAELGDLVPIDIIHLDPAESAG